MPEVPESIKDLMAAEEGLINEGIAKIQASLVRDLWLFISFERVLRKQVENTQQLGNKKMRVASY
ncbi:MAG: hypothetical protein KJO21_07095 [Verrucomicrobiae bacterium]|nr:hypothetical protein [Verrucomicrobiae bacterium]